MAGWLDPAPTAGSNVIILPDGGGLRPYYEALAQQFAEAGFHTVVIDFWGRVTGTAPRDESFDPMAHVSSLAPGHVDADVAAAAALLREANPGPLFTVGFCLGGPTRGARHPPGSASPERSASTGSRASSATPLPSCPRRC